MKRKKFISSMFSSVSTGDLIMMIVSAVVGALFSLYPDNVPQKLWWVKIVVLCIYIFIVFVFLFVAVFLEYKRKRFNYLHMIESAYKRKAWREVFLYGYPILRTLWLLSKVSLLLRIAKLVLVAVEQLDVNSVYDFKFNKAKIRADIYIGYLGYANNVLGNFEAAEMNIQAGIDIIEEAHKRGQVSDTDYLWAILRVTRQKITTLKGQNEELINQFEKYIAQAKELLNRSGKHAELTEYERSSTEELELAILTSEYVLKKYSYKNGYVDAEETIKYNEWFLEQFIAFNDDEWIYKSKHFIWELKLANFGYSERIKSDLHGLILGGTIVRRRLLKAVVLYFNYILAFLNNAHFVDNQSAKICVRELEEEIRPVYDIADEVAANSEDILAIEQYLKKKTELKSVLRQTLTVKQCV